MAASILARSGSKAVAGVARASARTSITRSRPGSARRYRRARSRARSIKVVFPERAAIHADVSRIITWSRPARAGVPRRSCAMASSSRAMLTNCRINDQGCWMCFLRAATAGCSAATQKRSVETTCFRRDRSSRYSATLIAETDPKTARNWNSDKFKKYIKTLGPRTPEPGAGGQGPALQHLITAWEGLLERKHKPRPVHRCRLPGPRPPAPGPFLPSSYASHFDQVSEDYGFQGLRCGDTDVASAAAHGEGLDDGTVFIKGPRVSFARLIVEIQFHAFSGFGVTQFEFARPGRPAVFVAPDLDQHQLVAKVRKILERALATLVVEKIRDHNHQPALGIRTDELAHHRQVVGGAARCQRLERLHHTGKPMAPASREDARRKPA